MTTMACPGCGVGLLVHTLPHAEGDEVSIQLTDDAREHLARCEPFVAHTQAQHPAPLWMRCSVIGCAWRSEFAAPSQDWDGYVHGVVEGATHMRTVHNDEPAAQQIERWLLDQARQAGRAVEGHRA